MSFYACRDGERMIEINLCAVKPEKRRSVMAESCCNFNFKELKLITLSYLITQYSGPQLWTLFFHSSEIKKRTVLRIIFLVAEETHMLNCVICYLPSKQLRLFRFNTTPRLIVGQPNIHVSFLGNFRGENKEYQSVHQDKLLIMPNY